MKVLGWILGLPRWGQIAGGAAALLIAAALWLHFHDSHVIRDHEAKIEAAAAKDRETAAAERVDDAARNTRNEENLHHAIDQAPPGGTLSPAAHALACERLRQHGRVPPACRSDRGERGQTGPQ